MHSHQLLASGLRRYAYASLSTHRAISTTMSLNQRRALYEEEVLPDTPRSNDFSTRLWKPSDGINFAPPADATIWHPAHGIVFSENKPLTPADSQKKEDASQRASPKPFARKPSLHRMASRARFQSRPPSESTASSPTAMSPPLFSGSSRSIMNGGKEPLQEVTCRSTGMQMATPDITSTLVASTGASYGHQRASVRSIKDPGILFSKQKEDEIIENGVCRNSGESTAWNSDLSAANGSDIDKTKCVGNKAGGVPPLVSRHPSSEQETTDQSRAPVAKAVQLGRSKKKQKIDEQSQAVISRLRSQYHERKDVFRGSNKAWSALRKSQAEAYFWANSKRAKAQVALIGTQIGLLVQEFQISTHQFREYQSLRASLDAYNSMDVGQRYSLLRQIRSDMINRPFVTCRKGCESVIGHLKLFMKTLEVNGKNIPNQMRGSVRDTLEAFPSQFDLTSDAKYYLYCQLFNPQVSKHAHIAAALVNKVHQLMGGVLYGLAHLRARVNLSQGYVNVKPAYRYRATLYDSLMKKAVRVALELRDSTHQYEAAIITCTSNHVPAVKRPIFVKPDVLSIVPLSIVPDQAWPSSPGPGANRIMDPSFSPLDASNTATIVEHPWTPSESLYTSTNLSNATTTRDSSCVAGLHAPDECTNKGSSHLNFTPCQTLRCSQSSHHDQPQISVTNNTLDPIEPKPECEDQAINEQVTDFLPYRIPEAKLKEAMLSSRSTTAAYWRYSLYEHPTRGKVKVHYCKSKETTERTAQLFLGKEVVGFDIEWKPQAQATDGLKKNVSLIQLASEERIALFHVARYPKGETVDDFVAPTLKSIMEDPNISKVGVSVKSDCTRLRKFMGIESRGLFELSHLYKLVKFSPGSVKKIDRRLVSLAKQVEEHLQLPLWKGEVRSSDWSTDLNYQQMQYAASDSYAGLQLFNTMESKRKALDPSPPRPEHAELNLPIRLANGQTVEAYEELEETAEKLTTDEAEDTSDAPLPAPSIEEMAREFLDIAIEDSDARKSSAAATKPPEVITADAWVAEYRASRPTDAKTKATPAFLRAYSLWHHQEVEVEDAARLLRDPPLQVSTVCCYILEAVRIEKLPFGVERLREVLRQAEGTGGGRYAGLRKMVE